jgi:hypothetical protein
MGRFKHELIAALIRNGDDIINEQTAESMLERLRVGALSTLHRDAILEAVIEAIDAEDGERHNQSQEG